LPETVPIINPVSGEKTAVHLLTETLQDWQPSVLQPQFTALAKALISPTKPNAALKRAFANAERLLQA
jgi:hypothetical protein